MTDAPMPDQAVVDALAEHDWIDRLGFLSCSRCGIVRRADGKNSPCKGRVKVGLRLLSERGFVVVKEEKR